MVEEDEEVVDREMKEGMMMVVVDGEKKGTLFRLGPGQRLERVGGAGNVGEVHAAVLAALMHRSVSPPGSE